MTNQSTALETQTPNLDHLVWESIDSFKRGLAEVSSIKRLMEVSTELLHENSKACFCGWYKCKSYISDAEHLPEDSFQLNLSKPFLAPNKEEILQQIASRTIISSEKWDRISVEISYSKIEVNCFQINLRLSEPGYNRENWIIISGIEENKLEGTWFLCHSITIPISKKLVELSLNFDLNDRISKSFSHLFKNYPIRIETDVNGEILEASDKANILLKEISPNNSQKKLPLPFQNAFNYWKKQCGENHTQIGTFSLKLGYQDYICSIKQNLDKNGYILVVLTDSYQNHRKEIAKRTLTTKQYEAFLYFENGATDSKLLANEMSISPRTAERYHANILYALKNGMLPS